MQHMKWNSKEQAYFGKTSDGKGIRVEGVEMAEAASDAGVDVGELSGASTIASYDQLSATEQMLLDPETWANLIGANQNVEYV